MVMTEGLRESISALMDDEASELEARRILSAIQKDDELRDTWERYQVVSLAIKGHLGDTQGMDVSKGIAQAIANEPVELQLTEILQTPWSRMLRVGTSVAVAASVAFLVVFGTLQINQQNTDIGFPAVAQQQNSTPDTMLAASVVDPDDLMRVGNQALSNDQKRLLELINAHAQQANMSRSRGLMPSAQLVSQETIRQQR